MTGRRQRASIENGRAWRLGAAAALSLALGMAFGPPCSGESPAEPAALDADAAGPTLRLVLPDGPAQARPRDPKGSDVTPAAGDVTPAAPVETDRGDAAPRPESIGPQGVGPQGEGLIEIRDAAAPSESAYRRAARERAMRRLGNSAGNNSTGNQQLRTTGRREAERREAERRDAETLPQIPESQIPESQISESQQRVSRVVASQAIEERETNRPRMIVLAGGATPPGLPQPPPDTTAADEGPKKDAATDLFTDPSAPRPSVPPLEPPPTAPPVTAPPAAMPPLELSPVTPPAAPANPQLEIRNPPVVPTEPAPITPSVIPPAAPPPGEALDQPVGPGGPALEVLTTSGELTVTRRRSKILRSRDNIYRVAVVDPAICDVVQFTPREVSIIGRGQGATTVTFWFTDGKHRPLSYLVRVVPDPEVQVQRERQYEIFEEVLTELFPDSKVTLTPVADKLLVRGEAKDAEEAAQILTIIRGEALAGRGYGNGNGANSGYNANTLVDGPAAQPISNDATGNPLPASNIVNMLRIPGIQQVALRVKIAELNRSAARNFGVNLDMNFDVGSTGSLLIQSLLNTPGTASIVGSFNNDQINFGIHYLKKHGVLRILSEPTLVTLSGRPASFVAGGEFAVPTTVGVDGASAVTTDFRSFGAILNFLPTVIDKDRIRIEVSPEFSKINSDLTVGDTPGLTTRAVTTTVEMREGQTLAVAGLLEDSMTAKKTEDIPFLSLLLGKREVSREETELIILVTPELVHPLDPEEVPPLPGFDVTEPNDGQFFLAGKIEGTPTEEFRSTVWPRLRNRYRHGGPAMISGPFGHGQ